MPDASVCKIGHKPKLSHCAKLIFLGWLRPASPNIWGDLLVTLDAPPGLNSTYRAGMLRKTEVSPAQLYPMI